MVLTYGRLGASGSLIGSGSAECMCVCSRLSRNSSMQLGSRAGIALGCVKMIFCTSFGDSKGYVINGGGTCETSVSDSLRDIGLLCGLLFVLLDGCETRRAALDRPVCCPLLVCRWFKVMST